MMQKENNLAAKVRNFVKGEVKDEEDALKGARDILAEQISEDERSRNLMRNQFQRQALIQSKVVKGKEAEEASAKYRDYFDFCEPLKKCSSHRLLALRRGESEGVLKVTIFRKMKICATNACKGCSYGPTTNVHTKWKRPSPMPTSAC